jgi:hypothetical protein
MGLRRDNGIMVAFKRRGGLEVEEGTDAIPRR